eukprot:Colp12_sorted_trinity150504_noHs@12170
MALRLSCAYIRSSLHLTRTLNVAVKAEVINPLTGETDITNVFHFTYLSPDAHAPLIMPRTYAEAIRYIGGQRRKAKGLEIAKRNESLLLSLLHGGSRRHTH